MIFSIRILICFSFFLFGSHVFAQNTIVFEKSENSEGILTSQIQQHIDDLHAQGGGILIFPKGNYNSGSIQLKSNVSIELKKGAVLFGSKNPEDYIRLNRWKALILAENADNIAIYGKGTINGKGRQVALALDSMFYLGQIDSSDYNFIERRPKYTIRPQIIEFVNCANVRIEGVTIKNAACWVQTYDRCQKLRIENIRVNSDAYWNNDGIDIIDSKEVLIKNCNINSSDDGICLKSSIDNSKLGKFLCENVQIVDCKVRSSASAVKLGSRSVGGFKNIRIENIKVRNTFRSAIALESVDGGILEDIVVKNINARNVGNAFFIRLGQRYRKSPTKSTINDVQIQDMKVKIAQDRPDKSYQIKGPNLPFFHNPFPASITGISGQMPADILLKNITISHPGKAVKAYAHFPLDHLDKIPELERAYPEFSMFGELPAWGMYIRHVSNINMKNIVLKLRHLDYRKAIVLDDVRNAEMENVIFPGDRSSQPIHQHKSEGIILKD